MQKFSSDASILNYVHSLPTIVSEKEEEFDFSISNNVDSVQISNTMDILEIILYFRSDPFTLISLELPVNSYMTACTNIHSFAERENCASTVLVDHTFGFEMNLFGSDMILFGYYIIFLGSRFQFHEI